MSQITPIQQVKQTLTRMAPQFEALLPPSVSVEKFTQTVQTAVLNDQSILSKDRTSLFQSCLHLAEMGLSPNKRDAALVSFGANVQAMPMVGGILKLIRESGEVKTILSELVFENDDFNYAVTTNGVDFHHAPNVFGDRGQRKGAYAYAIMNDGTVVVEILTNDDIEAIKKCSRSAAHGPWKTFESGMIKKSCIRRLSKRLPLTPAAQKAVQSDDQFYDMEQNKIVKNVKPTIDEITGVEKKPVEIKEDDVEVI